MRSAACALLIGSVGIAAVPPGHAQENPARLDSILPLLDPMRQDTLQLTMLVWAAESWATSPKAFPFLERLDSLSNTLLSHPDPKVVRRARHARGAYHFFVGYHAKFERNIPLALRSFEQAIADFSVDGHLHAIGEAKDALGLTLLVAGAPDKAETAFEEELRIAERLDDRALQDQARIHLASIAANSGAHARALQLLDACANPTPEGRSAVLNERARIHQMRGEREKAERLLHESLDLARASDNPWDQLPVLAPLARNAIANGQTAEGIAFATACVEVAHEVGDPGAACAGTVLAGMGQLAAGRLSQAEALLRKGLAMAEASGNVGAARELGDEGSMLFASAQLKDLLKAQGRSAEALVMTERWMELQDSVDRMNGRAELGLLAFKQDQVRDSLLMAARSQEAVLRAERAVVSERYRRNVMLFGVTALALLCLALWSRLSFVRRTRDRILEVQNALIESEKRREASEVRSSIARDVHDQLGSDLTKLSLLGGEVKACVTEDQSSLPALAGDIERIAREAGRALSDIIWAVDPGHDTLSALMDRARHFCFRMLKDTEIAHSVECVVVGRDMAIDPAFKRDLYLILREALNNAIKYARASRITVSFVARDGHVRLQLQDDGVGFSAEQPQPQGHGLRNLRQRAERMGATLVITSAPNGGTLVRLDAELAMANLPLQPQAPC